MFLMESFIYKQLPGWATSWAWRCVEAGRVEASPAKNHPLSVLAHLLSLPCPCPCPSPALASFRGDLFSHMLMSACTLPVLSSNQRLLGSCQPSRHSLSTIPAA